MFRKFPRYLAWGLGFAFVAACLQPVTGDFEDFWTIKLIQGLSGLPFGLVLAVVFTIGQNRLNAQRERGRTSAIAVGAWLLAKVPFIALSLIVHG